MTRNNLEEQLRWMMREQPSKPKNQPAFSVAQWSFNALDTNVPDGGNETYESDLDDDLVLAAAELPFDGVPSMAEAMHSRGTAAPAHMVRTAGVQSHRRDISSAFNDSDLEIMDLNSATNGVTRPAMHSANTSIPRKRNSDEFDGNVRQQSRAAAQRPRTAAPIVPVDVPTGPPPPYSTHPPAFGQRASRLSTDVRAPPSVVYDNNDDNDDDDNDEVFMDFNDSRARNITVQRRSPARRVAQSPTAGTSPRVVQSGLGEMIRETPSKTSTPMVVGTRITTPASTARPPPSTLPSPKLDTRPLDIFFGLPDSKVQAALQTLVQQHLEISDRAAESVEQDDLSLFEELCTELSKLKDATGAMAALRQRRQQLAKLTQVQKDCRAMLVQHISTHLGEGVEGPKAASLAAGKELEAFQAECLQLYNNCAPYLQDLLTEHTAAQQCRKEEVAASQFAMPAPVRLRSIQESKTILSTPLPKPTVTSPPYRQSRPAAPALSHTKSAPAVNRPDPSTDHHLDQENAGAVPHRDRDITDFDFGFDDDVELIDFDQLERVATPAKRPATPQIKRQALGSVSANIRTGSAKKDKHRLISHEDPQFASLFQHPWSDDVKRVLREGFKLKGFRQGQLEAINETLAGRDAFVLMPTGGGKSLCYQLPSQIKMGKTQGVTVVISPLLSLMEDQVQHLRKLNIQAFLINSASSRDERQTLLEKLRDPQVDRYIQILYVTPEMLSKSAAMTNALEAAYKNKRFARLVIDEAHCVSQWGHDFRPDYKLIGDVRRKFPSVPVMALTATATENVKKDTIHNLGIDGCKVFKRGFNRPNLYYEIRQKGKAKDDLEDIVNLIKTQHKGETGIIYCLSRKNCESLAQGLRKEKIKAQHYHAGMEVNDKTAVQQGWQTGQYQVIVATIAFGMGIDKANVRFVVHNSLPKSLEGYYQETGRAGRDGQPSRCYLYFGFQDVGKLRRMIDDSEDASREQKERQHDMLRRMVQYCLNKADCRRVQVLGYFSEAFKREDCESTCDNCAGDAGTFALKDVTEYALNAIEVVRGTQDARVTVLYCVDVFRGSSNKKIRDNEHHEVEGWGSGKGLDREDVERLFTALLAEGILIEVQVIKGGFPHQYCEVNPSFTGLDRYDLSMRLTPKGKKTRSVEGTDTMRVFNRSKASELPLSTNVSSPVHGHPKSKSRSINGGQPRKLSTFFQNGEDDDDESDTFEEVSAPSARVKAARALTSDNMIKHLDAWHQIAIENFLDEAKPLVNAITAKEQFRVVVFSDTVLREMAMRFTTSVDAMREIPNINKAHAGRFGPKLVPLLKKAEKQYREFLDHAHSDEIVPRALKENPNRVVISLDSDDENGGGSDEDAERVASDSEGYGTMDDDDFDLTQPAVDVSLAAFNSCFNESQSLANRVLPGPSRSKPARNKKYLARASDGSASSKKSCTHHKKNHFAKSKAGSKYSAAPKKSGGRSTQSARAKSSLIGMMPT